MGSGSGIPLFRPPTPPLRFHVEQAQAAKPQPPATGLAASHTGNRNLQGSHIHTECLAYPHLDMAQRIALCYNFSMVSAQGADPIKETQP